ncbi:MAG: DUF5615 family PIN-like protein [Thermoplasmata archaeon]
MRICLDENVPEHVLIRLRSHGHDVALAREEAGTGATDIELLKLCTQEERVLLTNDNDFDILHGNYHHEGILRYSINQPTKEGWKKLIEGIELIEEHMSMKNELQWPMQWWESFNG